MIFPGLRLSREPAPRSPDEYCQNLLEGPNYDNANDLVGCLEVFARWTPPESLGAERDFFTIVQRILVLRLLEEAESLEPPPSERDVVTALSGTPHYIRSWRTEN